MQKDKTNAKQKAKPQTPKKPAPSPNGDFITPEVTTGVNTLPYGEISDRCDE